VANAVGRTELAAATYSSRPAFVFVALNTWTMGFASARQVMSELGPNYVAVRPDHFLGLLKGAGPLGAGAPAGPPPGSSSPSPSSYCPP
jgi:hypothetical protein